MVIFGGEKLTAGAVAGAGARRAAAGAMSGSRTAPYKCKPSFRLKFSKHARFADALPSPFRFPSNKQGCNNLRMLTLRNEWIDKAMVSNKIVQDALKAIGGLAPRLEFTRLAVNGRYFGFYTVEEVRPTMQPMLSSPTHPPTPPQHLLCVWRS